MDISYKITFYSDWNCGSGLGAGADVDLLPIKDASGLPFVPGKTMKGLVREALETLYALRKKDSQDIIELMGKENKSSDGRDMQNGCSFFTNDVIPEELSRQICSQKWQDYLFRSIASTAIGDDGVAKKHSLRKVQTTIPCEMVGSILDVPENMVEEVSDALRFVKRVGYNRSRGLGRCDISVMEIKTGGKV